MTENSESRATKTGERIAKVIARSGVCSRRDAEKLITDGRVAVNGEQIVSPALNVNPDSLVTIDGKPIAQAQPPRLWRYHKPVGLVTTHRDPEGRPTVFSRLPASMPRTISIGRLDINSEGLLLLTNDGELARRLELPSGDGSAGTGFGCLVPSHRSSLTISRRASRLMAFATNP